MKKSFAVLTTLCFAATAVLAQTSNIESFSMAKTVLDRSVAAYGGRDGLNSISNVSIKIIF